MKMSMMFSYPKKCLSLGSAFVAIRRSTRRTMVAGITLGAFAMFLPARGQAQVVRTGYTSIVAANSAKCVDITGGSRTAGAAAIQWHCNGASNEAWTVQLYNGSFRIIEQQTGDCLVVSGSSKVAGAALVQEPCSGVSSELWSFTASGSNFQMINMNSGQCASVSGASTADAATIEQEPCTTASNFLFTFYSGLITSAALTVAQAAHSGQCMNVSGSSTAAGGSIIQWPCAGSTNEQWTLVPTSGSYYELVANNSGLCLSDNGKTALSTSMVQEPCSSTNSSDLFTLKPVGGSYEIVVENSGLCMSVSGGSQTAGTVVQEWTCSGALYQLWSLSAATLPSSWTAVIPLAVDPIGAANLPNGNLVMWSANDQYTFEGDIGYGNGQTYTTVFNPWTETSTAILVTNTGDDMFCPGTANLFNGEILVNGGDSSPKTSLYNPTTGVWTSDADMNIPRGYEADTVLTNGSVMTFGGSWSGGIGGKTAEVWTEGSGWTVLSNVPETTIIGPDPQGTYRGDNHLWLFSAPNGEVFHAGPSAQMHWITTTGNGTITSAGNRGNDPYAINGNTVMYDVGMLMKTGGAGVSGRQRRGQHLSHQPQQRNGRGHGYANCAHGLSARFLERHCAAQRTGDDRRRADLSGAVLRRYRDSDSRDLGPDHAGVPATEPDADAARLPQLRDSVAGWPRVCGRRRAVWRRLFGQSFQYRDSFAALPAECQRYGRHAAGYFYRASHGRSGHKHYGYDRIAGGVFRTDAFVFDNAYSQQRSAARSAANSVDQRQHVHAGDFLKPGNCAARLLLAVRVERARSAQCGRGYSYQLVWALPSCWARQR